MFHMTACLLKRDCSGRRGSVRALKLSDSHGINDPLSYYTLGSSLTLDKEAPEAGDSTSFDPTKGLQELPRGATSRTPKGQINTGILQTMIYGISLRLVLGTRMPDPYVYVVFWAPNKTLHTTQGFPESCCHSSGTTLKDQGAVDVL